MHTSDLKRNVRFICAAFSAAILLLFVGEALFCREVYVGPCAPFIRLSREEYLWLWDEAPRQYSEQTEHVLGLLNVFVSQGTCLAAALGAWPLVYRKKALLSIPLWGKILIPAAVIVSYSVFYRYVTYCVVHYPLYIDMFLPALCALAYLGFWRLDRQRPGGCEDGPFVQS